MGRKTSALLIAFLLCFTILCPASAETPRDITPLDYDTMPDALTGQHHYLLACVDSWEGNANNLGNTDGVILVTLDSVSKRIIFTTLTREMLVKRPDGGIGRFTFIAKRYGVDEMLKTVCTHFGVKVEKYAIFSMNSIQDIIDTMGGVTITVTDAEANYLNRYRISRDSTTPSMDKAGTYLFGGHAAVIYMRIRKVGGDGDAGRTRRIRTVLSTLTAKYENATLDEALTLLTKVSDTIVTTNMTLQDMLEAVGYAMELRGVIPEGYQMPPNSAMEDIVYAGMQTRQVDFEACREYYQQILNNDFTVKSE
ncbi:MAG: LCP family protein [Eubacteriales bacterium]|nr:LCP family protein [Eubacteriales bacterium]